MSTTTNKREIAFSVPAVILFGFAVIWLWDILIMRQAIMLAAQRGDIFGIFGQMVPVVQAVCAVGIAALLCFRNCGSRQPSMRKLMVLCYWTMGIFTVIQGVKDVIAWQQETNEFLKIFALFPIYTDITGMALLFVTARCIRRNAKEVGMGATTAFVCGVLGVLGKILGSAVTSGISGAIGAVWDILYLYAVWSAGIEYMGYTNAKATKAFARKFVIVGAVVLVVATMFCDSKFSTGGIAMPRKGESAAEYIQRADPSLYQTMLDRYNKLT